MSNLYPKAHSCVAVDQMTDGISFTSQVHNTETRSLVWEKGKPYVVVLLVRNILQTCSIVDIVGRFYGNEGQ